MSKYRSAFTLIELLVVITIISVLIGIAVPTMSSMQTAGRKVQSLSNMRQLGTAFQLYCGQNDGALPGEGESSPTWGTLAGTANATAWFNVLPATGGFPAASSYASQPANFYNKANLLYVPAANYPSTKVSGPGPLFAVAYCSKLASSGTDATSLRLQNFQQPSHTVIFQESGVTGEKLTVASQSAYNGQSKSFASRSICRYSGKTVIVFADGHAEALQAADIIDASTGKAYFPQSKGRVYWTLDPAANANL